MITVIEENPKQVSCKGCGSILDYHNRDVQEYRSADYSGNSTRYAYIECPKCGRNVIISNW